ncbi:sulfurtransferase TusA family protein [Buchnera aphidicola]|uniref:sulfurtransferase TusA family protein n=1 Tax=Buchnera aphidicola TaxID=9 RepID=UPI003464E3EB
MSLKIINLTNFNCPNTIIEFRKKIKNINCYDKILILSNDISTKWDIPLFCNHMNYKLIFNNFKKKPYQFLIQKFE